MNSGPGPELEPFIDTSEAAEFLRRSPKTIRAWVRAGIIPAHPIGAGSKRRCLFLKSELDQWVRSQKSTQEANSDQDPSDGKPSAT